MPLPAGLVAHGTVVSRIRVANPAYPATQPLDVLGKFHLPPVFRGVPFGGDRGNTPEVALPCSTTLTHVISCHLMSSLHQRVNQCSAVTSVIIFQQQAVPSTLYKAFGVVAELARDWFRSERGRGTHCNSLACFRSGSQGTHLKKPPTSERHCADTLRIFTYNTHTYIYHIYIYIPTASLTYFFLGWNPNTWFYS